VRERLEAMFTAYGDGLAALDVGRIVPFYGYPCMMLTDSFVGALSSADELTPALRQANGLYRRFGVDAVRHRLVTVDAVTDKITRVGVRWTFLRAGEALLESDVEYLMRAGDDSEPRIHVVVSIDEEDRPAELIGEQRPD
jgi:hypothetical protein